MPGVAVLTHTVHIARSAAVVGFWVAVRRSLAVVVSQAELGVFGGAPVTLDGVAHQLAIHPDHHGRLILEPREPVKVDHVVGVHTSLHRYDTAEQHGQEAKYLSHHCGPSDLDGIV